MKRLDDLLETWLAHLVCLPEADGRPPRIVMRAGSLTAAQCRELADSHAAERAKFASGERLWRAFAELVEERGGRVHDLPRHTFVEAFRKAGK